LINAYKFIIVQLEMERQLGIISRIWGIILKWILKEGIDGANWIRLAQDRIQWRAFVNTVMNIRVPERKQDIFWQAE
jgi:hypothetical protein